MVCQSLAPKPSLTTNVFYGYKIFALMDDDFFFFFWESRLREALVLFIDEKNYKASRTTRGVVSSRVDSYQICSSLPNLARLARKWATELPKHFTWVKVQTRKPKAKHKTSWITWPYSEWETSLANSDLIIISASPSNTTIEMFSSLTNVKALRHAKASTISAHVGTGIRSAIAPIQWRS